MARWTFWDYVPEGNSEAPFRAWYRVQEASIRAVFFQTALELGRRSIDSWIEPFWKEFEREHKYPGLGEIRFSAGSKHEPWKGPYRKFRAAALLIPDESKCILLAGAEKHENGRLTPELAFDWSLGWARARQELGLGKESAHDY